MRAVYVADLHGDRKQYDELYRLLREKRTELLLIGGDLLAYSKSLAKQLDFIEHEWIDFARSVSIPILLIHGNIEWTGAVARYEQLAKAKVHQVKYKEIRAVRDKGLMIIMEDTGPGSGRRTVKAPLNASETTITCSEPMELMLE